MIKNFKKPYKVISLFSCCGGSDLGMLGGFEYLGKKYSKHPVDIVFGLDNDPQVVATYNANFKVPAILCDIKNYNNKLIPDGDIVIGGFPCQSFSTVNPTKDPYDDRGKLYKEMVRIVKAKKPIAFIGENVKGLARLKNGEILKVIIDEFSNAGYEVSYEILNAANYGVPQKRERVFIVGIRKDIKKKFIFPKATHSENGDSHYQKWVSLGKVIDDLINVDKKYYFSEKAVLGMKNAKNNMKRGLAQDLSSPCLTITSHLAKVSLNSRDPVLLLDKEKEVYRRFTPLEAARIQSFPDSFKFIGSEHAVYRQIGNAIPPVLMWHLTKALLSQLP